MLLIFFVVVQDYQLASGDSIVRFSCVGINLARSSEIVETNTPIDSAIIGMTANVFVNGSAFVSDFFFLKRYFQNF